MQAHVRREMQQFPEFDLIVLDGRQHTIYTIVDQMAVLPVNTVVLVGTWRVDKNESYFMRNATYSMMSANLHMPAFSLASVGLGHTGVLEKILPEKRWLYKKMNYIIGDWI